MPLNTKGKFDFLGKLGGTALCVVLLIVSLLLVVVYTREGDEGPLHSIQNTTSALVSPLSAVGTTTGSLAVSATTAVSDLTADDATMSQLRENNEKLSQMVVELEEYRQEAQRLQSLLNLSDVYGFTSVSAHVSGYSSDSYNKVITIDAGSNSGVQVGQPVMGATGVIGQVVSTTSVTSQVRLLTDAQSGVSALIQSSRAEGIVTGSVEGTLYLEGVDDSVTVNVGDAIITSGLGGGYYRGLVIGTVAKVETRSGDALRTIIITPNASFSNLGEVLVVQAMSNSNAADDATTASSIIASANSAKAGE